MPAATTYTLTAPTTPSGNIDVASGNFTVSLGAATNAGVVITPAASTGVGTFTPTTVTLSTGSPTLTFTYTPINDGPITITTTNNGSLTDPAGVLYTALATGTTAYSVLKNPTNVTRKYPFLGPRGITLAAGARYSYPGSIYSLVRGWSLRDYNDLIRSLVAGTLEIVSTPAPIVKDTASGLVKVIGDTSGAITFSDPSWGTDTG